MKTTIAITYDENVRPVRRVRQPAIVMDVAAANRRLVELFNAMTRERWLPIGLRTMIVHDLPQLRRALEGSRPKVSEMLRCLRGISSAALGYSRSVMRSETMALVREFEYELSALPMAA